MKRKDPVSLYLGKRKLGGDVYDKAADVGMKDSDSPVAQAVLHRLIRQHPDVIGKYGPDKVMDAVDELADFVGDVEEIGSSDVSIWTKEVIDELEARASGPQPKGLTPNKAATDYMDQMDRAHDQIYKESPDDPERRPNHVVSISHKNDGTTMHTDKSMSGADEIRQRIRQLGEGLNKDDIKDRVQPTVHFDEFVPKMGTEDNVIVSSFRILGEAPAKDLENFLEKGYPWILDAETSAGEIDPGYFVVFVEAERRTSFPEKFYSMLGDIYNITDIKPTEWIMKYYQGSRRDPKYKLTVQNMITHIPLSPRKYRQHKASESVFESMLNIARIPRKKGDTHEFRTIAKRSRT
jgi:hypothetical protein